ncbi:hypothetical protein HPB47_020282 [Ixodes persulcatus]|uniref:Uncharacterized protein n=1 Tax=Ixodes persulcatus TaxID=34615 RepID=A0AC60QG20_IXOPE|nr:hypothetical protein HPB47_020282 [Ixodes persulcatus]
MGRRGRWNPPSKPAFIFLHSSSPAQASKLLPKTQSCCSCATPSSSAIRSPHYPNTPPPHWRVWLASAAHVDQLALVRLAEEHL